MAAKGLGMASRNGPVNRMPRQCFAGGNGNTVCALAGCLDTRGRRDIVQTGHWPRKRG